MSTATPKPPATEPAAAVPTASGGPETGDSAVSHDAPAPTTLEADEGLGRSEGDHDDPFSLDGDGASSTTSISSSIFAYRTLQGRTYHSNMGNAEYWGANDEPMNEALDIVHHVLTLLLDGQLHRAPIDPDASLKVLDVGTGTGIWAIDFGDQYPNASVLGTDVSPIQPNWVPPNVSFEIDDCTLPWTFTPDSFDFIHIRWLFGSIVDWDELYRQAFAALKPGGWIESHEASTQFSSDDGTVTKDSAMGQFGKFFADGGKKMGRCMTVFEDKIQRKGIEAAGFVNVHEEDFKSPLGGWPKNPKLKEMGRFQLLATSKDIFGTLLYMGDLMGWRPEELEVFSAKLKNEFRDPKIHGYYWQKIVWAQKPME